MNYPHEYKKRVFHNYNLIVYRRMFGYAWRLTFSLDPENTDTRWAAGTCRTKDACFDRATEYRQMVLQELQEGVK